MFFNRITKEENIAGLLIKRKSPPHTASCYSGYNLYYDGTNEGGKLYFGFFSNPKIRKLVGEFNSVFKNLKVNIIKAKKLHYNDAKSIKNDYINSMLQAHNTYTYGALGGDWTLKEFMKLDNIDLMNKLTIYTSLDDMPYNSKLLRRIRHET